MKMGAEGILAVWEGLPDPTHPAAPAGQTIQITLPESSWTHILDKHIRNQGEPWEDILGQPLRALLCQMPIASIQGTTEEQKALAALEKEIRQSMSRPLVFLYWVRGITAEQTPGAIQYRVWGMVLPSGATAYAHQRGADILLMTCYFPKPSNVEPNRQKRWKKTLKTLLWRYCRVSPDRKSLCYPPETHAVLARPTEEEPHYRCGFRFVTWQMWGFLSGEPGSPWRGRLDDWDAAGPPPTKTPRRHRLRPRTTKRERE